MLRVTSSKLVVRGAGAAAGAAAAASLRHGKKKFVVLAGATAASTLALSSSSSSSSASSSSSSSSWFPSSPSYYDCSNNNTSHILRTVGGSKDEDEDEDEDVDVNENSTTTTTRTNVKRHNSVVPYSFFSWLNSNNTATGSSLSSSSSSLIIPTLEASQRALRLVCTAFSIALDYQYYSLKRYMRKQERITTKAISEFDIPLLFFCHYFTLFEKEVQQQERKKLKQQQQQQKLQIASAVSDDSNKKDDVREKDENFEKKKKDTMTRKKINDDFKYDDHDDEEEEEKEHEHHKVMHHMSIEEQCEYWTELVEKYKLDLQHAQAEYTKDGSESSVVHQNNGKQIVSVKKKNNKNHQPKSNDEKRKDVYEAAIRLSKAEEKLASIIIDNGDVDDSSVGGDPKSAIHYRAANRILNLCRSNGGVYVKIGQHLANLDYLLPTEYIQVLSSLFDDSPTSSYDNVRQVIKQDLGSYPEELFHQFQKDPIASASLAQVHVAHEKGTGEKLAVKVQHAGLRETSVGDLFALTLAVRCAEIWFKEDFIWGWLVDEIAPQLPRELDFKNEGRNAETAASHFDKWMNNRKNRSEMNMKSRQSPSHSSSSSSSSSVVIPKIYWNHTSDRVLTMKYEEGFKCTDLDAIEKAGLKKSDVAKLIASVLNTQVFLSGFVHCDPHPANVLIRPNPHNSRAPQLVLLDHGLYKTIDDDFRMTYAKLWRSLMLADIPGIKDSCENLGVTKMYPLLAAMLTSRPFDEIIQRSKYNKNSNRNKFKKPSTATTAADKAMIKGYAQRYIHEIINMLDVIPRQMLLLLKMNDCLRHLDVTLQSSHEKSLLIAGQIASRAVYEHDRNQRQSSVRNGIRVEEGTDLKNTTAVMKERIVSFYHDFTSMMEYWKICVRVRAYEWICVWMEYYINTTSSLLQLRPSEPAKKNDCMFCNN